MNKKVAKRSTERLERIKSTKIHLKNVRIVWKGHWKEWQKGMKRMYKSFFKSSTPGDLVAKPIYF